MEVRLVPAVLSMLHGGGTAAPTMIIQPLSVRGQDSGSDPAGTVYRQETTVTPNWGFGSPQGYSPQQIRTAYGIDAIRFGTIVGVGSGQTIAIVDAYDDPGLVSSTDSQFSSSDLARFDQQFNLPDPPSFLKLNQNGSPSNLPGTDPSGAGNPNGNWEYEEALDVEWAHAIAPGANIILVECNSSSAQDLYAGVAMAASLPGVSSVSMSWGDGEFGGEGSYDSYFQTPSGHQGVTFVAGSGDGGSPGIYPAYSSHVVAVGGTSLWLGSDGSYPGETGWSGSGGGISAFENEPAYQQGVQSTGFRTIPDVAFDGNHATPVSVYDSYDDTGAGPWNNIAGTSLGAPAWAALIAIANQGRVAEGGSTLDGPSQTLPALYTLPASDFHDITSGSNGGFLAGPGYDEVTGLGTPRADLLVPDLADYGMPDQLVVTEQPPNSVTAGSPFEITVSVENRNGVVQTEATGTITLAMAGDPSGSTLNGTLTATISNGVATFSGLTIDRAATGYTIQATSAGLSATTTQAFDVQPSAPVQLAVTAQPDPLITAGTEFGLTVSAEDGFGNLVPFFVGPVTVALAANSGGGSLGGTLTIAADAGVATFSGLTLTTAGTGYTLQVTSSLLTPGLTSPFNVTPAEPSRLVVSAQPPNSVTAGTGFGLAISVEDAYGNLETTYDDEVSVALVSGLAGSDLGGTLTVPAIDGVAAFSGLRLTTAGDGYLIQATGSGLDPANTGPITVGPAEPARLAISSQPPASLNAGSAFGLSVAVEDAFGNLETTYDDDLFIALVSGPAGGDLGGTLTVPAIDGVATFSGLRLTTAGDGYMLQATGLGLDPANSVSITVTPAAPARLVMASQPLDRVTAGQAFGFTVLAEDRFGNVTTDYDGDVTVALASGPEGGRLEGAFTAKSTHGVTSFSGLILDRSGSGYVLRATAGGLTAAATRSIRVDPAAATRLVVTSPPPATITAGSGFGLVIEAEDPFGNPATSFQGAVTIALANHAAGDRLGGIVTATAYDGVASLAGLWVTKAGAGDSLSASAEGLAATTTPSFTVVPAVATQLIVTSQPPGIVTARRPFRFTIAAEDRFGNVATGYNGGVTAALAATPGRNRLAGTLAVQASGGRATFANATMRKAGKGYAIVVTGDGLTSTTTRLFKVVSPIAKRSVFATGRHDNLRRLKEPRAHVPTVIRQLHRAQLQK
jgi:hypothetical protein